MTVEVTQADRDAAADSIESWEPGPEMTVVKLARAFARHRIVHQGKTPTVKDSLTGEAAELAQQLNNESCGFGIGHAYLMQKAAAKLTELAAEVEQSRAVND